MVVFILLFLCVAEAESLDFRIVDLTHDHSKAAIFWPGNPDYNFTILSRENTTGGYWLEMNYIATPEHSGTHLDAPSHYNKGKWRTHNIPIENLIGPGVVIDVKSKVVKDPDYRVTVSDLEEWEKLYGRIPDGAILMMNSGWDDRYPNPSLVFNSDNRYDASTFHFPSWHADTITWLIKERSVSVVGVDTPSTDYGQSTSYPVHQLLGSADICGAENVANLDKIPTSGSIIFVGVMKIHDGSGGPARIIALLPTQDGGYGITTISSAMFLIVILLISCLILHRMWSSRN